MRRAARDQRDDHDDHDHDDREHADHEQQVPADEGVSEHSHVDSRIYRLPIT